ncbi:MAG TPA: CPBP family intramembrane glutamic endopeptidase [Nitrospiraceae bacterium]
MRGNAPELIIVYGGGTAAAYLVVRMLPWAVLPVILGIGAASAVAMMRRGWSVRTALRWPPHPVPEVLRLLAIWLVAALAVGFITWWLLPERRLWLPRSEPLKWSVLMVLYPFLSALPQEVMFRTWYFNRYEHLFGRVQSAVIVNGLVFGGAHVVMDNWVAVAATVPLGWLLGWTYARTRSLSLVWIEHTLYGVLIFTVGPGLFFMPVA